MTTEYEHVERLPRHWWCELHKEVHEGDLTSWTMAHRSDLHPVYVHWRLP